MIFDSLIKEINDLYGYDLSEYSRPSLERRIKRIMEYDMVSSIDQLREKIKDKKYFNHLIEEITVNVTEMFRDVAFFKAIREEIVPILATYPNIRIWHAGCSTGEEVFSMAVVLEEEGLLDRTMLYATDLNQSVIDKAESGRFLLSNLQGSVKNYQLAGGKKDFNNYFTKKENFGEFPSYMKEHMFFTMHNLVTDKSFNEFNLIICHNVLIYFNKDLQNKVVSLFYESLPMHGFLSLGPTATLAFSPHKSFFRQINDSPKIWQKYAAIM